MGPCAAQRPSWMLAGCQVPGASPCTTSRTVSVRAALSRARVAVPPGTWTSFAEARSELAPPEGGLPQAAMAAARSTAITANGRLPDTTFPSSSTEGADCTQPGGASPTPTYPHLAPVHLFVRTA